MRDTNENRADSGLPSGAPEAARPIQQLRPPSAEQRMEGVGFSSCGRLLAVAASDTDRVFLYRRPGTDCLFEEQPYSVLCDDGAMIRYPHDVAFSLDPGSRLLAVAQRTDSLLLYRRRKGADEYGTRPAAVIAGAQSRLDYSDGCAFVPPRGNLIAVCNLRRNSVSFHAVRHDDATLEVTNAPAFVFTSAIVCEPDGLAFSADGEFMALANHGDHSIAVFRRSRHTAAYDPEPVAVMRGRHMRFPHSVAFTPRGDHVLVSNAGANFVGLHRRGQEATGNATWSARADALIAVVDGDAFTRANCENKMEGGPKGVAVWRDEMAVCSPQVGTRLFRIARIDAVADTGGNPGLSRDDRPRRAPFWLAIDGGGDSGVLVHVRRGVQLELDRRTLELWSLCTGEATIGDITQTLTDASADAALVEREVIGALEKLEQQGAIER